MIKYNVFVYGTLKKGHGNHRLLEKAKFLGKHITKAKYTLLDLGPYPAVLNAGDSSIKGEIYEIDQNTLRDLDRLEGYPHLYQRHKITSPHGEAWMYTMEDPLMTHVEVIDSGEWEGEKHIPM